MKIWVMSDIHLELAKGWDLPALAERPDFDVMVVAGDLVTGMDRGVKWLRERVDDRAVIYLPGNHEAYGQDIDRTFEKAKEAAVGSNICVLNNEAVELGGVRFVASTLWTDFNLFGDPEKAMVAAAEGMNDYRRIRKRNYAYRLRPRDTLARHLLARRFIEGVLQTPFAGPTAVVTHHVPYRGGLAEGYEWDIMSSAYVSDLSELIQRHAPEIWIYGHVHESRDEMLGLTRMVSNAKGYGPRHLGQDWENARFNPRQTIAVHRRCGP